MITVTRADKEGLERTALSLLSQSVRTFEWIVIDGGSIDGTVDFLTGLRPPFEYVWKSERDTGIYDAMNKGLDICRGDCVIFLNAGDEMASRDAIAQVYRALERFGKMTMIGFDCEVMSVGGHAYRKPARGEMWLYHGLSASHQSMVYPALIAKRLKYDSSYKCCGDYDFTVRLWRAGTRYVACAGVLSRFHLGGFSTEHPEVLLSEAQRVQRESLRLAKPLIAVSSMIRRAALLRTRRRSTS